MCEARFPIFQYMSDHVSTFSIATFLPVFGFRCFHFSVWHLFQCFLSSMRQARCTSILCLGSRSGSKVTYSISYFKVCILSYIISIFKHFPIPAASRHLPFSQPRVERGEKVEVQSKKFLSAFLKTPNFKTTCSMHNLPCSKTGTAL